MNDNIDLIRWHILDSMADDWESPSTIQSDLRHDRIELHLKDINIILQDMHSKGLVKLMKGTGLPGDASAPWYALTAAGEKLLADRPPAIRPT